MRPHDLLLFVDGFDVLIQAPLTMATLTMWLHLHAMHMHMHMHMSCGYTYYCYTRITLTLASVPHGYTVHGAAILATRLPPPTSTCLLLCSYPRFSFSYTLLQRQLAMLPAAYEALRAHHGMPPPYRPIWLQPIAPAYSSSL